MKQKLSAEEFDFSQVEDKDLEVCRFYEYARESKMVIKEVGEWRKKTETVKKERRLPYPREWDTKFTDALPPDKKILFESLTRCDGFPDSPWQCLDQRHRQEMPCFRREAESTEFREQLENPGRSLKIFGLQVLLNAIKDRVLCLSAKPEKALLVKELEIFLAEHFSQYKPVDGRGRGKSRDALNALGAMRLRYQCRTLSEAQKMIAYLQDKNLGMSYGDRTAWDRACKNAAETYRDLLQVDDLPIHHPERLQK